MALIETIYTAMVTRNSLDSDSDDKIVVIGNQLGVDKFQFTFAGNKPAGWTGETGDNRKLGRANLYISQLVPQAFLDTQSLSTSYFRVGIRGDDLWRPEHFFLWGTAQGRQPVVPLAMGLDLHTQGVMRYAGVDPGIGSWQVVLSTDQSEGDISFPLTPVLLGDHVVPINRLMFVTFTSEIPYAGTDNHVKLQIQGPNGEMGFDIPDTSPQGHLEQGSANLHLFPTPSPFTRGSLSANAIRLFIGGDNPWLPQALYLFGLDTPDGHPNFVVPLVHLENEPIGYLSTDSSTGQPSAVLPLAL